MHSTIREARFAHTLRLKAGSGTAVESMKLKSNTCYL